MVARSVGGEFADELLNEIFHGDESRNPTMFVNDEGALFVDSVRSPDKKVVIRLVQEDFLDQLRALPVPLHRGRASLDRLQGAFAAGGIPIVLISSYRIYREKFPHWVVVTGFDERYVYVHDPFVDAEAADAIELSLAAMAGMIADMKANPARMRAAAGGGFSTATGPAGSSQTGYGSSGVTTPSWWQRSTRCA